MRQETLIKMVITHLLNQSDLKSDMFEGMASYTEIHRPQFHFTAQENWINDPNGLVYMNGVWHLFFQHNPEATVWGNMTWGHAVSEDLIHWRQLDHVLHPDELGSMFSGCAVVDHANSAGFGSGTMLVFYTAAGDYAEPKRPFTQCLAYSVDGERWQKYSGNPVVEWIEDDNRDPKVIWHQSSGRWIMALYLAEDRYCLLASENGLDWKKIQDLKLEGDAECPDFFPLIDDSGEERWVFWGASGRYLIGDFDGFHFSALKDLRRCERGPNGYAAQTWSNVPDGRCIQISWMAGGHYPEMPFNQQLSIPVELKLAGSGVDVKLLRSPIAELNTLRGRSVAEDKKVIAPGSPFEVATNGPLFDATVSLRRQDGDVLYVVVRGYVIELNWVERALRFPKSSPHKLSTHEEITLPDAPQLTLRFIVDRASIEIFVNEGEISASVCYLPDAHQYSLVFYSHGGEQALDFELHELDSIWQQNG